MNGYECTTTSDRDRDELAKIIAANQDGPFGRRVFGPGKQDYDLATALLAAGYQRIQTVDTTEELDALPEGTQIVDQYERLTLERTTGGKHVWFTELGIGSVPTLPAFILPEVAE